MKYLIIGIVGAALAGLLTIAARAEPPRCESAPADKSARTACKQKKSKTDARTRDGVSRADAESNDRAMSRNILQSIEGEVRRQRLGN